MRYWIKEALIELCYALGMSTCTFCKERCKWAFDPYNKGGDCLMEK